METEEKGTGQLVRKMGGLIMFRLAFGTKKKNDAAICMFDVCIGHTMPYVGIGAWLKLRVQGVARQKGQVRILGAKKARHMVGYGSCSRPLSCNRNSDDVANHILDR